MSGPRWRQNIKAREWVDQKRISDLAFHLTLSSGRDGALKFVEGGGVRGSSGGGACVCLCVRE